MLLRRVDSLSKFVRVSLAEKNNLLPALSLFSVAFVLAPLCCSVPERLDFPATEKLMLSRWRDAKCFERSLELSKGRKPFSFYDGPPFATGLPHYGHILAGTIKVKRELCTLAHYSLLTNRSIDLLVAVIFRMWSAVTPIKQGTLLNDASDGIAMVFQLSLKSTRSWASVPARKF